MRLTVLAVCLWLVTRATGRNLAGLFLLNQVPCQLAILNQGEDKIVVFIKVQFRARRDKCC